MAPSRLSAAGASAPSRGVLLALLALNVFARLIPALRPLQHLDDLTIPDDAYLSLTLARNIARGLGPLYGLEPTSGFQPLYVFLIAPVYALIPHDPVAPIRVAMLLLILCDTLALWLIIRMCARFCVSRAVPVLVAVSWVLNPYAIQTSLNALETSLSFLLLAVSLEWYERLGLPDAARPPLRALLGLGAGIGLAAWARIDNWLLVPALALPVLRSHVRAKVPARDTARVLIIPVLAAAFVYLPWVLYSVHTTGDAMPISGRAVRFSTLHLEDRVANAAFYGPLVTRAAYVIVTNNLLYLGLIAALLLGAARGGAAAVGEAMRRLGRFAPSLIFGALILIAYVGIVFGPWHYPRYLFPLVLPLALCTAVLMDLVLARAASHQAKRAWLIAFSAAVIAGSLAPPDFARLFSRTAPEPWGYLRIGEWVSEHFEKGTVIGAPQSGAIGYFADSLTVVNLDGVVNKACYEALRDRRALDYIRGAGIEYVVWQGGLDFVTRSQNYSPEAVTFLGTADDIRTWGGPWKVGRIERGASSTGE